MWYPNVLVVSGGGMKGFYLPGVFVTFDICEYLKNVHTIAGTSIGGFMAALWCLQYSGEEMVSLLMTTDISEMFSELKPTNFISKGWFGDGEWFDTYISKSIFDKIGKKDITLLELFTLSGKKLILNSVLRLIENNDSEDVLEKMIIMDYQSYPNMSLVQAIRMTSCIPGFLKPIVITVNGKKYECYDGGTMDNYLIHMFDPKDVLGVYLGKRNNTIPDKKIPTTNERFVMVEGIEKFIDVIWEMFNNVSFELEKLRMRGLPYKEIIIPTDGIKTLSLHLTLSKKYKMILDGIKESLKFIMLDYRNKI